MELRSSVHLAQKYEEAWNRLLSEKHILDALVATFLRSSDSGILHALPDTLKPKLKSPAL